MPRAGQGSRKLQLDQGFRRAVRSSGLTQRSLAMGAGFPRDDEFSTWMQGGLVRATPLVVGRLQAVARAVGHAGEILADPATGGRP